MNTFFIFSTTKVNKNMILFNLKYVQVINVKSPVLKMYYAQSEFNFTLTTDKYRADRLTKRPLSPSSAQFVQEVGRQTFP